MVRWPLSQQYNGTAILPIKGHNRGVKEAKTVKLKTGIKFYPKWQVKCDRVESKDCPRRRPQMITEAELAVLLGVHNES